jgi:phosphotransferase family enzyme
VSAVARSTVAALLGPDILAALARIDGEPIDADTITGLPAARTDRATFRIVLQDGRVVKARRMRRARKADRFARIIRALAHESLPAPLLVDGRVTIEAWIDGAIVATLPLDHERLMRAADLLASIHVPDGARPRGRAPSDVVASTRRRLANLAARGALARDEVRDALHLLQRLAPPAADLGITHNDFCAENLVEMPGGRLVVVDNEGLRQGFLDYDVARTWYRWSMSDAQWGAFVARYRSWRTGGIPDDHARFWRMAAVVKSAHLRAARDTADAFVPIERLRALLAS